MRIISTIVLSVMVSLTAFADIHQPDGLRIPGDWNGFANTNGMGGSFDLVKIVTGTVRWQTTFQYTGTTGDQTFKFVSGSADPWANQWYFGAQFSDDASTMNTLETYTWSTNGGTSNNKLSVTNGKYYTVNWKDAGYGPTTAIFMETSSAPVTISAVSDDFSGAGNAVNVSITMSGTPSAEEKIYVRYTTDDWTTSSFVQASGSGTSWTATIPSGSVLGTSGNQYYVMTTTVSSPTHADADMQTIKLNNNSGLNYPLPVELTSFTAVAKGRGVELAWKTASELNNKGFEIQRKELNQSADGSMNQWHGVGFIAGHGTTNAPQSYTFVDNSASGTVQYRLKQVDNDGSFEYSNAVEVTVAAPAAYTLSQNHPNPFNPATTISYSLPAAGFATLKVYDMLGKEVATLVNGMQESGANKASFDASQLPSGIYFARLSSGSFNSVIKMTLMK